MLRLGCQNFLKNKIFGRIGYSCLICDQFSERPSRPLSSSLICFFLAILVAVLENLFLNNHDVNSL